MKIAFLLGSFPNLTETFILNQITGLIDRGHDVDIYALNRGDVSLVHAEVKSYNLLRKAHFINRFGFPQKRLFRIVKGMGLVLKGFSKSPRAVLRALNFFKYGKKALSLDLIYKIYPFLSKSSYDVIQCHFGSMGNLGVLLKHLGAIEGKIITTFHGSDLSFYIRKHNRNIYDFLFEKGDIFLPISEKWKEKLIDMGCGQQKIIVHRMGVNLREFSFSPRHKQKNIKLLTIGRFVEKKGIEYGIRAVAKIIKKYPNIEYNIVGDGLLRVSFQELIKEFGVGEVIRLLGWKTRDEIRKLMQESDIIVAPSVTSSNGDQEGIPVILIEALATGLPAVSTWHSGIPELIQDGESGFLVPERDVECLADRIKYLIEHPDIWSVLGHAGRKHVEENFDIEKLNDSLVKIYEESVS